MGWHRTARAEAPRMDGFPCINGQVIRRKKPANVPTGSTVSHLPTDILVAYPRAQHQPGGMQYEGFQNTYSRSQGKAT